jgi:hypothetical protein
VIEQLAADMPGRVDEDLGDQRQDLLLGELLAVVW